MVDLSWLSAQAKTIHDVFVHFFYGIATVLILIGVVIEYFKLPLGGSGLVPQLVARTLISAVLLHSYAEVSNTIAEVTDALAHQLGDLNQFKVVLASFSDRLHHMTVSWTSVKDSILMLVSFVLFFILYVSVYLADAGIIFGWTLLYIFSPLLIVLYILPVTAQATSTLYRSLFEISAWKIVWSVLATLLWSFALSTVNRPEAQVDFITVLALNLILAASILFTPKVVHALMSKGIAGISSEMAGVSTAASMLNPGARAAKIASWGDSKIGTGAVGRFADRSMTRMKDHFFPPRSRPLKRGGPSPDGGGSSLTDKSEKLSRAQPSQQRGLKKMSRPPEWLTRTPPNTQDPPEWMRKKLERERGDL